MRSRFSALHRRETRRRKQRRDDGSLRTGKSESRSRQPAEHHLVRCGFTIICAGADAPLGVLPLRVGLVLRRPCPNGSVPLRAVSCTQTASRMRGQKSPMVSLAGRKQPPLCGGEGLTHRGPASTHRRRRRPVGGWLLHNDGLRSSTDIMLIRGRMIRNTSASASVAYTRHAGRSEGLIWS